MNQSLKKNIPAILILSTLVFTHHATAKDCYEKSPNFSDQGEEYYNLEEPITLSNKDQDQIKSLFRKIEGKWKGALISTECKGSDNAPKLKIREGIVTAKIKSNTGTGLIAKATLSYPQKRIKRAENLSLLGKAPIFGFDFPDKNHFVFSEKYRRANVKRKTSKKTTSNTGNIFSRIFSTITGNATVANNTNKPSKTRTSRLIEIIYDINLNAGTLTFTRSYYTNGVYTGEERWVMYPS